MARHTRHLLFLVTAVAFSWPISAEADSAIEGFVFPCGKAGVELADRVAALGAAGWVARSYGDWAALRAGLEESILVTDVTPGASSESWKKARLSAVALAELAANATSADFAPTVMTPRSGAGAILMIFDQSVNAPGMVHCLYSGPMPELVATYVARLKEEGRVEKSDTYLRQFSWDEKTRIDGKEILSSVLISNLTPESEVYLGGPPQSAAAISIYTQPLSR